jgi:hypothetical protein
VLTVGNSAAVVEGLLGNGLLSCPGCDGTAVIREMLARFPAYQIKRTPVLGGQINEYDAVA